MTTTPALSANPLLAEALRYYAERRTMNNPKGWAHVLRVINRAIKANLYPVTDEQITEARTILGTLIAAEELPDAYGSIRARNDELTRHGDGTVPRGTYLLDTEVLLRLVARLTGRPTP